MTAGTLKLQTSKGMGAGSFRAAMPRLFTRARFANFAPKPKAGGPAYQPKKLTGWCVIDRPERDSPERNSQLFMTPPGRLFIFCLLADPSEKSKQTFRSRDPP